MQKQGAMMIVCTRINTGKEEAYHKWYDEHASIMFDYPGMERVSRNRCVRPIIEDDDTGPEYITLYELKEKADLDNYFKSPQMDRAKKQFEEEWEGLGDVLWSGFYEPLNVLKRKPLAGNKRFLEIVGLGPKPGQDAAHLDFYVDHITKMFEYDGITEIDYVRMFMPMAQDGKSHDYVAVYDFKSEEAMNDFYRSPVFTAAKEEWEQIGQTVMDLHWAACYESVTCLER